jgi:hypothetical protein
VEKGESWMWKLMRKEGITTVTEKCGMKQRHKKVNVIRIKEQKRQGKYVMEMKAEGSLINFELQLKMFIMACLFCVMTTTSPTVL